MVDWNLVFLISGAGYGINILVLVIISMLIWLISMAVKWNKKEDRV